MRYRATFRMYKQKLTKLYPLMKSIQFAHNVYYVKCDAYKNP